MYSGAFEILDHFKLKHPQTYEISQLNTMDCDKEVFLRYCEQKKNNNRICTVGSILTNYRQYVKEIEKGWIVQIADAIRSDAGCVVYFEKNYIYGEFVEGEPISILRRGICGLRFCMDKSKKQIYVKKSFQNWICKNEEQYFWYPYNGMISNNFNIIIAFIRDLELKSISHILLEINLKNKNVIFSDAKYYNLGFCEKNIFKVFDKKNDKIVIKGSSISEDFKIDGLDIDNFPAICENIYVYNGALLSHYITHNYEKIKNITFLI